MIVIVSFGKMHAQTCNNTYPLTGNVSVHTLITPKPLTIGGNINCSDVSLQLRYDNENPYYGILALSTPGNLSAYSTLTEPMDFVLSAITAKDLIFSTQKSTGHIRFSTSIVDGAEGYPADIERMTITPQGRIGIWNNEPNNLFSVRTPIGIGFYSNDEGFQDLRFNCYQTDNLNKDLSEIDSTKDEKESLSISSGYLNIQTGYAGIIQTRNTTGWGSMLLAVTKPNANPDTEIDFFEQQLLPKGIMIQNFPDLYGNDYATVGIGAMPNPTSRLTISGSFDSYDKNILSVVDYLGSNLLRVSGDGLVIIGTKTFVPETDPPDLEEDLKLTVDGAIVAKEILIENSTIKWPDFVFDDDYMLLPLSELEAQIAIEGKLPGIPSAQDIKEKGLNLAGMDAKLLQKIEELTLYLIQLNKDNQELRKEIQLLKNKR